MLETHLDYLLTYDDQFRTAYGSWDVSRRRHFLAVASELAAVAHRPRLVDEFRTASEQLRRVFLAIPEHGLEASRINVSDWLTFIADDSQRSRILDAGRAHLGALSSLCPGIVRVYGGLKDFGSAMTVRPSEKPGASSFSTHVGDTWDAVRFRIVVDSALSAVAVAATIWEQHIDSVIKCRNYFRGPRTHLGWPNDPYRAVHFQLPMNERMFEVQVMTVRGETVSYLDHAMSFKRRLAPRDDDHKTWLLRFRAAAVVCDARAIEAAKQSFATVAREIARGRQSLATRLSRMWRATT